MFDILKNLVKLLFVLLVVRCEIKLQSVEDLCMEISVFEKKYKDYLN